ncbi:hypothetical protein [Trichothermofontia sp.]
MQKYGMRNLYQDFFRYITDIVPSPITCPLRQSRKARLLSWQ